MWALVHLNYLDSASLNRCSAEDKEDLQRFQFEGFVSME